MYWGRNGSPVKHKVSYFSDFELTKHSHHSYMSHLEPLVFATEASAGQELVANEK